MFITLNKNIFLEASPKFRPFSVSAIHRVDDNTNPSNDDNSESSEPSNEGLSREQLTIEQIIDDRSNEGQNTALHYELTPEQREELDGLQRRMDLMAGRIYDDSRNLDPSDPNSATRCGLLRSGLERYFDNFLNDVDNLTGEARPIVGDSWHADADLAERSDSYTTESEHLSDDPDYQTVEKYPLRFPAPVSSKRNREESEELLNEEKKEESVSKRPHLEESSAKLPESTMPEASSSNSIPEASSSKPADSSKPKSSLLDDFADTSTEFPDYTGGDD